MENDMETMKAAHPNLTEMNVKTKVSTSWCGFEQMHETLLGDRLPSDCSVSAVRVTRLTARWRRFGTRCQSLSLIPTVQSGSLMMSPGSGITPATTSSPRQRPVHGLKLLRKASQV
ncbi:hypothetical protein QQF64_026324 [Cirrhinus molitorella]|uniref:Uncharacterized protein n=1 Tax=Cirrhinus molitorella TaxID=172907 RepID=A0ABR3N9A5_9TELE